MNPDFVSLLCCPATKQSLRLHAEETNHAGMVMTGTLTTESGLHYPIVRGIPRFVDDEQYSQSFGFEWTKWPRLQFEDENANRPMAGHTKRMWQAITQAEQDIKGKTIVEFGCGPGRFLDVVRGQGGIAVGIDMSAAVEAARKNFADDPNVLIVQGDILKPPFAAGIFDGGYSIGVLHHTPEPLTGLKALVNSVQPGGWIASCVYPKGEFYDYRSVARLRWLHNKISPWLGFRPALWYSFLSAYVFTPLFRKLRKIPGLRHLLRHVEKNWLVCLDLPDPRWRVLDIFDAVTPEIASTHTAKEVDDWLRTAGCQNIKATPWCSTSFSATRKAA
jgi:SAM-dependent methyltransferase